MQAVASFAEQLQAQLIKGMASARCLLVAVLWHGGNGTYRRGVLNKKPKAQSTEYDARVRSQSPPTNPLKLLCPKQSPNL